MSDKLVIPMEKDFYEKVEQPNYLKHIPYGDSVTGDNTISCIYRGSQLNISFSELFNKLSSEFEVKNIEGKEYIFFSKDSDIFKIQAPDLINNTIKWVTPKYFMRHFHDGEVYQNYLTNTIFVTTTLNHSFVEIDMKHRAYKRITPIEAQIIPILGSCSLHVPLKYALIYGLDTKYDYLGAVKKSRANQELLTCVRPWKICKKIRIHDFHDYVYDFSVPGSEVFFANNVLVHNTDSLYIEIPVRPKTAKEKIKIVNKTSNDINNLIIGYTKGTILPRCGYSPERNETKFKEEMVIDRLIMLAVKKTYAYLQIASEAKVDPETNELVAGNIFETPQVEKKSGFGVKSDMVQMTKQVLDYLIDVVLSDKYDRRQWYDISIKGLGNFHSKFIEDLKTYNVSEIGTPVRWQKKINAINAMKLYNAVVEKHFQYLSVGYLIYCNFASEKAIRDLNIDIDSGKINAIAIPPNMNPELVDSSLKKYGISFDKNRQWENIINKTCKHLLDEIKKASSKQ